MSVITSRFLLFVSLSLSVLCLLALEVFGAIHDYKANFDYRLRLTSTAVPSVITFGQPQRVMCPTMELRAPCSGGGEERKRRRHFTAAQRYVQQVTEGE